ncbi:MAG: outer membrane beta-barrel protein [Polaribacter sp.]|nr:outer membrane beta-barrel protein [Polaribacter sp.]
MGDKKIDNLFQEQLKNLEVSPNKRVWNNIEAKLKKKKRKVFPFWWFSGAVASIILLTFIFNQYSSVENPKFNINPDKTITIIPEREIIINNKIDSLDLKNNRKNEILLSKEDNVIKVDKNKIQNSRSQKEIYKTRKSKTSLILNYNSITTNFGIVPQESLLKISKRNTIKYNDKKLDIASVIKAAKNTNDNKSENNWSIAPSFAVLKSNSLSNTSPINAGLSESTSGENSYSYGVQVAYQINKKWSIQSGIHLQENSYANNQVSVNSSSERNPFATAFSNGDVFSFNKNNDITESAQLLGNSVLNAGNSNTGNISQNYGYVEIPIEVKYNFSNSNKLQTQFVTGFSTLFLNKNEVILDTQNFSRTLEAANLNNINFSGNIGFDFNYNLSKKIALNLNPMFKVQFNTFSNNSNGFAPFNIGIYTGIKYQF